MAWTPPCLQPHQRLPGNRAGDQADLWHARAWRRCPHVPSRPRVPQPDAAQVLIVEDNGVNQKVLTAMLAGIGYRADVACNGVDALEALDRNRYTAVLMDSPMPDMDGYQTTTELRAREGTGRHTSVIAVTASAMATDRARRLAAGMDDYLIKPVKSKDLADKLVYWIDK